MTTTAVGRPKFSKATLSCIQHDVQEPQSPMAVRTMSFSAAIRSGSSGRAFFEELSLR
ncbi:MAG: hypothetical protein QF578_11850 [Alphaproteobacteria bacterium]|nr:hypothetical protein [Alphaproteobacteria bacterium]MDP6816195.1 hypothetical protein [Alphaproteobacteria bacterium]